MNSDKLSKEISELFEKVWGDAAKTIADMKNDPAFKCETAKAADSNEIRINFNSKRWSTVRQFIGCAFEMLLSGKTTLVIKKRQ